MTPAVEQPKTTEAPRGTPQFEGLRETLLSTVAPDGHRAEIVGGNILMSLWPRGFYLPVMRAIRSQLEPHARKEHIVDHAPFLFTFPGEERAYGPDIYAAAASAFHTGARYTSTARRSPSSAS
ncbi:hypothetical protein [Streptomyces wuyuanensis]|uniref:hypothetical protein n=1 Tax=Streptomyces wuyuanensis TaxID=1196353 RepID=UPI00343BF352